MINTVNSQSVTAFQEDVNGFIENLNQTKEPLMLTVDGTVQAVVVDPLTYQEVEKEIERQHLLAAIAVGEADIQAGRLGTMEELRESIRAKYGF